MNKKLKHIITASLVVTTFSILEPVEYIGLLTKKAYAASNEPYLKGIYLSEGDNIDFNETDFSYIVDVDKDTEEVMVRAKPENDDNTVKINGSTVTKDDKYKELIPLVYGKNKIKIEVRDDSNSSNVSIYTVYVYRGGKDAVYLNDINIDERNIGFKKDTTFYNIELDEGTEIIKLDAIAEDDRYTVKINDKVLDYPGSIKIRFKGIGKYTVNINVKDDETEREQTYILSIYVGIPISPDISGSINAKIKPNQWIIVNGRWQYNDSKGECLKDTWYYDNKYGKYFRFNKRGYMQTGWVFDNEKYYFMDKSGYMQTGWIFENGEWYFFDSNGVMLTGWIKDNEKWYLLNEEGAMQEGWILENGNWYYLNSKGSMETGWIQSKGQWYYLNSDGTMETGWILDKGKWYFTNKNGEMQTGWIEDNDQWYFLSSDGSMKTGWIGYNRNWYFLDTTYSFGAMRTGWTKINGEWYFLNNDGTMKSGEWLFNNGNWYYISYAGPMWTGWLSKDNKFYYFNEDGSLNKDRKTIGGYTYNFNSDGSVNFD